MFDMGSGECILLIIVIVSSIVSIIYILWGMVIYPLIKKDLLQEEYSRMGYLLRGIVMLLCPMVGPGFFLVGQIMYFLSFHGDVDLEDVIFSKDRVKTFTKAADDLGRDMAPLEEALAVSNKDDLRTLMMNIVRGDVQKTLTSISLALNSADTETAHYAASVLRDELNDFRITVQRIYKQIKEADEEQIRYAQFLLSYMNCVLEQKVFTSMEQESFVRMMEEVGDILYEKENELLESTQYEWLCLRLMEIKDYDLAEKWCIRGMKEHPEELGAYTCQLNFYFSTQKKEQFFEVMEKLRKSRIILDSKTLEMIRLFSREVSSCQ